VPAPNADEGRAARSPEPIDLSALPLWSRLSDGRPLAAEERERYERLLDRPVDGVRVHEGVTAPPGIEAKAWSVGGHVVLGPELSPDQRRGALDHEVVHAAGQLAAGSERGRERGPGRGQGRRRGQHGAAGLPTLASTGAAPSTRAIEAATAAAATSMAWGARAAVPVDSGSVPRGLPPGHDGEPLVITASSFEDAAGQFKAILDETMAPDNIRYTIVGLTAVAVFDRDGTPLGVFRLRIPARVTSGVHVQAQPGSTQLYRLLRSGGGYQAGPQSKGDLDFGHDITEQEQYDALVSGHSMVYVVPAAARAGPPPPEPSTTEQPDPLVQFQARQQANLPAWPGAVVPITPQVTATNTTGSFLMHVENNQGRDMLDRVTHLMQPINFRWEVLKLDERFMPVQGATRSATRFDAVKGAFERRIRNADADRRALLGEHPERQSIPESVIRQAMAEQMHDARLILSMVGEVALQLINTFVGGPDNPFSEDIIDVPFREPGDYFVRCLATPVSDSDAKYVRATTVAGVTVSVFDIAEYAQEALGTEADEAERAGKRIAAIDAQLAAPPGTDQTPGAQARQARDRAFLGFERTYSQAIVDAKGDQGAILAARREYLQARIAWLSGPALPPGDDKFQEDVARQLTALRSDEQEVGSTIDLAQSQLPSGVTPTGLMTGVLIGEETGRRVNMTFSMGERAYVATDRLEVIIADVTGGQAGRVFNGMGDGFQGAGRPDAVRAAMRDLRENLKRGRGELAYRLPARYAAIDLDLPNPMQLQLSFLDMASETAEDAAHALTLAALLAAPFTEGASLAILGVLAPIQVATSLYRIVDRAVYGDLELDAELVGDFINIASFGLGGVGGTSPLASRGVQIVAGAAGVAVKLLQYGNYVVIAWTTFRELTAPDPPGADPREGRRRRLRALLSAFEQVGIPVAEGLKNESLPPGTHPASQRPPTEGVGEEGIPPPARQGGRVDPATGAGDRPEPSTPAKTGAGVHPATGADLPALRRGLPSDLAASMPITRDTSPDFGRRSVHVEYTVDGGIITDIRLRVGPEATFREIAEHVATIRSMQRYQGLSGRVRALLDRITAWLTRNPGAGPGTRGWEARLELEKLPPIIEARAREMADPATAPARRAELELELADLERQMREHAAAVDSVATGQGFVAAEGLSAGKAEAARRGYPKLPDPGAKASDGTPLGEYIWRYTAGDAEPEVVRRGDGPKLVYDKVSGTFVPDTGARADETFGTSTTKQEAYTALGGYEPASGFGKFTQMLMREGIVPNHEALIVAMQDPAGRRYKTVRSNLKEIYAQAVVDHITDPVRISVTPFFEVLRRQGMSVEDARQAVSHSEMLRVTRNLYSSDRGAVAERWYEATFGKASATQVTITPEQATKMGTSISQERRLDRVSGSFIEELKNVSGPLDADDRAQIDDQLRLVGIEIPVEGQSRRITMLKVSMLDPQGVLANANYMYSRLEAGKPQASVLIFEIYNSRGTSLLVTTDNRAILHDPAKLKAFLAYGTVGQ
jgi:hypothetical protein